MRITSPTLAPEGLEPTPPNFAEMSIIDLQRYLSMNFANAEKLHKALRRPSPATTVKAPDADDKLIIRSQAAELKEWHRVTGFSDPYEFSSRPTVMGLTPEGDTLAIIEAKDFFTKPTHKEHFEPYEWHGLRLAIEVDRLERRPSASTAGTGVNNNAKKWLGRVAELGSWIDGEVTYLAIPVAKGADLSCKATRRDALAMALGLKPESLWPEKNEGEDIATPPPSVPVTEGVWEALRGLVKHCWVYSGYHDCGRDHMTEGQKALYDSIIDEARREAGDFRAALAIRGAAPLPESLWKADSTRFPYGVEYLAKLRGCTTGKIVHAVLKNTEFGPMMDGDKLSNAWDIIESAPLPAAHESQKGGEDA